jgi:RNA methyltransferase, TrmH family
LHTPAVRWPCTGVKSKRYSMHDPLLSQGERRLIDALKRRRKRRETGLFLAEGVRVAEELLAAGIVPEMAVVSSALEDTGRGREVRRRLPAAAVRSVSEHELARLAATDSPQGVLIVARAPEKTAESVGLSQRALVLVLDEVQDPGNFGTLVRSAAAFDVAAVVALPGTVDPWNPKAVRAAAGMSFHVPILAMVPADAIAWLRTHEFQILVTEAGDAVPDEVPAADRVALVVGNEGAGVSAAMRAEAARAVSVPMPGRAESLNVAVAAGILLHHFSERLRR